MIGLFLGKRLGQNFKIVCLLLILYPADTLTGTVNGGNRVWRINNPLSDNTPSDAYASLGVEGEYFIYMIIERYDTSFWDNQIKGKNVIKIK